MRSKTALISIASVIAFFLALSVSFAANKEVKGQITDDILKDITSSFNKDASTRVSINALTKNKIADLTTNREVFMARDKNFTNVIRREAVTDQEKSGRCWIFAGLNLIRYSIGEKIGDDDFELSQSYSFFWHKLELANHFLENIIATVKKDHTDREIEWLYKHAIGDGGYWNMVVTTVEKYGVVPKSVFPETINSSNTNEMNNLLDLLVRKHAVKIRELAKEGKKIDDLRKQKMIALKEVYRVLALTLSEPPKTFEWRYEKKEKDTKKKKDAKKKTVLTKFKTYTPKGFLKEFSKINLSDHVTLVNDPSKPYYMRYRIPFTKNVVEDKGDTFVNVPMDDIIQYTKTSILKDVPVWFACDVGSQRDWKEAILKANLMEYNTLFGVDFSMPKRDRMISYLEAPNHAMVFTGVDIRDGKPVKWLVENSWGATPTENNEKGFWMMYTDWFKEYLLISIIEKRFLSSKIIKVSKSKPVELQPWDPMW